METGNGPSRFHRASIRERPDLAKIAICRVTLVNKANKLSLNSPQNVGGTAGTHVLPQGSRQLQPVVGLRWDQSDSTSRRPSSTAFINRDGIRPHFSARNVRSNVMICDTFATESFGRPESLAGIRTLPGASARRRLEVITTATTVRIRLRLNALDWTMITGRRNPGSDAIGSGSRAHHTVPRSITTPQKEAISPEQ